VAVAEENMAALQFGGSKNQKAPRMSILRRNLKAGTSVVIAVAMTCILGVTPSRALAVDGRTAPGKLRVGTAVAPPFAMKTSDGRWEGLGIELWQKIAAELDVEYEFAEFESIEQVLEAFKKKELDLVPAMAITESLETDLDFSNAFIESGSAIAVRTDGGGKRLRHFGRSLVDRLFSLDFFLIMLFLTMLSLVAGVLVWLFERHRNSEMFGGGLHKGLGQGIWWAMVTMTTVGYGDKAPKTLGGRIVALLWMGASIMLVAGVTAAVTASLTVDQMGGKIRGLSDLSGVRVGSVADSESLKFLVARGVASWPFENAQEGLQALVDQRIDAFVHNELILKYRTRTNFPGRVHVLPGIFDRYFGGIAMPPGSPLREPVNRALLKIIATDDWIRLTERYLGPLG
jgi:polar amino acid transport system substrate-binding protein